MATVAEMFTLALRHHESGRLAQAEQVYQQILEADPQHADSHHLLGVLAYQMGHFEVALRSIHHALKLNNSNAAYFSNLGLAYESLGNMPQAVACYHQAL